MKLKKTEKRITTLIGIIFILAFTTNSGVNALNSNSIEATPLYIKASPTENPIIGTPSIDPTEPGSFDDATVSCAISDPDSIQNATLFWNYKTINGTFFSTAMSGGQSLMVDETENKPEHGYLWYHAFFQYSQQPILLEISEIYGLFCQQPVLVV